MSRFFKIMIVAVIIAVSCFFLMIGSFFKMITHVSGGSWDLNPDLQKPHVTIVNIEGPILSSKPVLKQLEKIKSQDKCRGILVRLETPGGAVAASQEIFHTLKTLAEDDLPVVISMGNTAASGGYYVALAGGRIFANPGTLTGSIGVIAQFPVADGLLKKFGVKFSTVKSGELKDAGSPFRQATSSELKYFQELIDGTHSQFVKDVQASRGISTEDLEGIADGRVLTGVQALGAGLVDTLGGLPEAKAYIAGLADMADDPVFIEPKNETEWLERLSSRIPKVSSPVPSGVKELLKSGLFYIWPMGISLADF